MGCGAQFNFSSLGIKLDTTTFLSCLTLRGTQHDLMLKLTYFGLVLHMLSNMSCITVIPPEVYPVASQ